jgi:hypothetical protein
VNISRPDYISEAKRCLATNSYVLVAETTTKSLSPGGRLSRLRDVIKENGFEYITMSKEETITGTWNVQILVYSIPTRFLHIYECVINLGNLTANLNL